ATLLVVGISKLTEGPIARQQEQELLRVLNQIILPELHDNDLYQSCTFVQHPELGQGKRRAYRAQRDGKPTAIAVEVTAPNGYSGAIHLLVAVHTDGTVAGVHSLSHQKTRGLGDKIKLQGSAGVNNFNCRH